MSWRKSIYLAGLFILLALPGWARAYTAADLERYGHFSDPLSLGFSKPELQTLRNVDVNAAQWIKGRIPHEHFHAVARDRNGQIAWIRDADNMVTTQGCNALITDTFKASGFTSAWYVGEIKGAGAPTFNIADALDSHSGWTAIATSTTDITNGTYPALTLGSVTGTSTVSADNSGSVAVFNQNSTITLQGFYVSNDSTVGDNAAGKILYGEASFTAAPVAAGYTVNITVTLTTTPG